MNAKELRLHNYVMYNGMVISVSEILSPKPRSDERYNNKYVIELFDGAGLIDATLEEIEPISLNEEWILKSKIEKQNGYPYKFLNGYLKIRNGVYFFKYYDIEVELPFFHNLQNLYFALTGAELTVA